MGNPFYSTKEELQAKIDEYFEVIDAYNEKITFKKPYTVTGLALHLGFAERKSLIDYSEKPEFLHTIKKAKSRIEQFNEERLHGSTQVTGVIFNLKNNFGWRDSQDVNLGGQNGGNPIEQSLKVEFVKPSQSE